MKKYLLALFSGLFFTSIHAQLNWKNVDSAYGPLPEGVHVYYTEDQPGNLPFRAYYVVADLGSKQLDYTVDTTHNRRFTPQQFWNRNHHPVVVVNGTFFSFQTNRNLNVVMKNGRVLGYNIHAQPLRGKDTLIYRHTIGSAIGISKKRKADIAWLITDSSTSKVMASQKPVPFFKDSVQFPSQQHLLHTTTTKHQVEFDKWKMKTAIGGGPVLLQDGAIKITNNEEYKFAGKAINDKHPRTAMGYTRDNRLVILVVEGRNPEASGASLTDLAQIMKDLGCVEALNLDGGGSSCMLVNGKETIRVSDGKQRPVPAVFIIGRK